MFDDTVVFAKIGDWLLSHHNSYIVLITKRNYLLLMFVIEDDWHQEPLKGEYQKWDDAMDELRRLATISWDQEPNLAPCASWRDCGRKYEIVEYNTSTTPWKLIMRHSVMEIDAKGVRWDNLEMRQ